MTSVTSLRERREAVLQREYLPMQSNLDPSEDQHLLEGMFFWVCPGIHDTAPTSSATVRV